MAKKWNRPAVLNRKLYTEITTVENVFDALVFELLGEQKKLIEAVDYLFSLMNDRTGGMVETSIRAMQYAMDDAKNTIYTKREKNRAIKTARAFIEAMENAEES